MRPINENMSLNRGDIPGYDDIDDLEIPDRGAQVKAASIKELPKLTPDTSVKFVDPESHDTRIALIQENGKRRPIFYTRDELEKLAISIPGEYDDFRLFAVTSIKMFTENGFDVCEEITLAYERRESTLRHARILLPDSLLADLSMRAGYDVIGRSIESMIERIESELQSAVGNGLATLETDISCDYDGKATIKTLITRIREMNGGPNIWSRIVGMRVEIVDNKLRLHFAIDHIDPALREMEMVAELVKMLLDGNADQLENEEYLKTERGKDDGDGDSDGDDEEEDNEEDEDGEEDPK